MRADFDPNGFRSSSPITPATQSVSAARAFLECKLDQHASGMLIRQWRCRVNEPLINEASVYSPLLSNTAMQPVVSVGGPTLVGADEQIVGRKTGDPPPIAGIGMSWPGSCAWRERDAAKDFTETRGLERGKAFACGQRR
jgi:hypothetical protein